MTYLENNVFEEALNRIRFLYNEFDDIMVSMSGGKDSTVLFHLTLMVAKEMNRLPVKVFWLDQEAEWKATEDYMETVMKRDDVKPYWYQIPFDFTNSLSPQKNFLRVWDENAKDIWIHPQNEISIKENPSKYNRFHDLVKHLPKYCKDKEDGQMAVLTGMRANESLNRRTCIMFKRGNYNYKGYTWVRGPIEGAYVFYPIYDFVDDDIWTAIARNKWEYNRIYDLMYQKGVNRKRFRVSALIHETAWHSLEMLQELEPETYDRFCKRVAGANTFSHAFDMNEVIPRKLPFAFKDWKEYRDYLLMNLVKPEYWEIFLKRWINQDTEDWYKTHVYEVIVNDIDGTLNNNAASNDRKNQKLEKYKADDEAEFYEWRAQHDKRTTDK